ncbi:peptidase S41 [Candidatus Shapirobacteria bacterium CG09_land_8_20_14_0_10_47_13]|uniref:Peptidase S41 n=1 Tax=Candidatus Shapirobacteria bacterium CG09_land_8_20_14_0_10_47_13 TaxID=1974481 RepID=A0A2H0WMG4_9BACT|nr:MAG: peptidase S41 [Candidatus Shapirobacteria bacterium CG09_land_8_20_14_0_10_47_13]
MARLNLRQIRVILLAAAFLLLAGGIGYSLGSQQLKVNFDRAAGVKIERTLPAAHANLDFSLFWEVWDRLAANYLDKGAIKPAQMIYGAIQGMTAALGDPYTVFLPPTENKQTKDDLNGAFEGVGIQLGYDKDENLIVVSPLKDLPAAKAGIKAGDLILKIDTKETTGVSLPEAVSLIRGPAGTKVRLTLRHEEEQNAFEKELIREAIVVSSVEVSFVDKVAVLKLSRFGERTDEEWNKGIDEVINHQPGVSGLILDLRNNPGGYLSGSIFTAAEFLNSGVVVQQEQANGQRESFAVERKGKLINLPVVVLINKGSASAAEILAGALQEHKRARVVGEKSFGKGTIQEAQELTGGAGLHITTARWLLPSGKSIDKNGITPDVEVKDDPATTIDEQLEKAKEMLLK